MEIMYSLRKNPKRLIDQLLGGTKLPTVKELHAERTRLIQERQAGYAEYQKVRADCTEFIQAKQNADVILRHQQEERESYDVKGRSRQLPKYIIAAAAHLRGMTCAVMGKEIAIIPKTAFIHHERS